MAHQHLIPPARYTVALQGNHGWRYSTDLGEAYQRYVEFFPNTKQENLHWYAPPVPVYGYPLWQQDYEQFMRAVGFQTKFCKPHHPFTKDKVERLVCFVKDNFLAGRTFWNVTRPEPLSLGLVRRAKV